MFLQFCTNELKSRASTLSRILPAKRCCTLDTTLFRFAFLVGSQPQILPLAFRKCAGRRRPRAPDVTERASPGRLATGSVPSSRGPLRCTNFRLSTAAAAAAASATCSGSGLRPGFRQRFSSVSSVNTPMVPPGARAAGAGARAR